MKVGATRRSCRRCTDEVASGEKVGEICRRLGVSEHVLSLKKQFASMGVQELRELQSLRDENVEN